MEARSVTIALEGVTRIEDPSGDLIEVTGERDQAVDEDQQERNRLDLVEIELYGPAQWTSRSPGGGARSAPGPNLHRPGHPVLQRIVHESIAVAFRFQDEAVQLAVRQGDETRGGGIAGCEHPQLHVLPVDG